MDEKQKDDINYFAMTDYRGVHKRFGIRSEDRRYHMYVIGKTGTGKSTLLGNMILNDMKDGKGLALADPHGDLAQFVLKNIPSYRKNDLIYFNPADREKPVGINILHRVDEPAKPLVVSSVLSVFKKLFAEFWGPRTEHLLRGTLFALMDYNQATLLDIPRFLINDDFRNMVLRQVRDNEIIRLWTVEYAAYDKRFRNEAIAPILNKVGAFLCNPLLRSILGQRKNAFDMRKVMDKGKILIMNLAKGEIGEDVSMLLGALLTTKIQLAAMSRVDTPIEQRRDFYCYLDEFQSFITEGIAEMLAEARKMRLNLIICHQYLHQLPEKLRKAILGNVGTIVSFGLGSYDAEVMADEFYPFFRKEDFVNLSEYRIYVRMMIRGRLGRPFSGVTDLM